MRTRSRRRVIVIAIVPAIVVASIAPRTFARITPRVGAPGDARVEARVEARVDARTVSRTHAILAVSAEVPSCYSGCKWLTPTPVHQIVATQFVRNVETIWQLRLPVDVAFLRGSATSASPRAPVLLRPRRLALITSVSKSSRGDAEVAETQRLRRRRMIHHSRALNTNIAELLRNCSIDCKQCPSAPRSPSFRRPLSQRSIRSCYPISPSPIPLSSPYSATPMSPKPSRGCAAQLRPYTVVDLGGHSWTFTQSIANVARSSWGGTRING